MAKILFWNVNKKDLSTAAVAICAEYQPDIAIFCELSHSEQFERALGQPPLAYWHLKGPATDCTIGVFTRYGSNLLRVRTDDERHLVLECNEPGRQSLRIVALHLPSKLYKDDGSQQGDGERLLGKIVRWETQDGDRRTVLVGDFNANPFERALLDCKSFHAMPTERLANEISRTVGGEEYLFFYNPMWRFFGDAEGRTPGTYFWRSSSDSLPMWNVFDQVLVRPQLSGSIVSIRIIDRFAETSLLNHLGRPDTEQFSDHLPIFCDLISPVDGQRQKDESDDNRQCLAGIHQETSSGSVSTGDPK